MANLSYLTRRNGGFFYVQIRITVFSGTRILLRFSLRTRDYAEAKFRLFAYLGWLIAMQNPNDVNDNIDLISAHVDVFLKEGVAEDAWHAHHRHHYLRTATALLADWRMAQPCPIQYARFYARQRVFAQKLTQLAELVFYDFDHHGIANPDPDYLKPPKPKFQYFCDENDKVEEIVENDGCASWPQIPYHLMPEHLRVDPDYDVGDAWGKPSRTARVSATQDGPEVSTVGIGERGTGAGVSRSDIRQPSVRPNAPLMSELLEQFLREELEDTDAATAERDVKPYVLFAIHIMTNKSIQEYTRGDIRELCLAMSKVPLSNGIGVQTPIERYEYGKENGIKGLAIVSQTTIQNRYICAFKRFWKWAKEAGYFAGDIPLFEMKGKKAFTPLPRDSFIDDEIRTLFSMPTFVGHTRHGINTPGPVLRQGFIYWNYVIINFAGMRPAEIAQLDISDLMLVPNQGIYYFDLRPFYPAKGRIALEDMKIFKTEAASRLVPVHPALIELGLLERATRLSKLGHRRLFPDCRPKLLNGTDLKWGHAAAKDWQGRKMKVTKRENVSAYSGRHSMNDLLRELDVSQHDREKFLGHAHPGVNGRYGRKGLMPDKVIEAFVNMDATIMRWLREHLVSARDRIEAKGMLIEDWAVKPTPGVV